MSINAATLEVQYIVPFSTIHVLHTCKFLPGLFQKCFPSPPTVGRIIQFNSSWGDARVRLGATPYPDHIFSNALPTTSNQFTHPLLLGPNKYFVSFYSCLTLLAVTIKFHDSSILVLEQDYRFCSQWSTSLL